MIKANTEGALEHEKNQDTIKTYADNSIDSFYGCWKHQYAIFTGLCNRGRRTTGAGDCVKC